jgi:undecaprenyl-diphosphatase
LSAQIGGAAAASWLRRIAGNSRATLATLMRPPFRAVRSLDNRQLVFIAVLAVAAALACMVLLDPAARFYVQRLPRSVIDPLDKVTDFGRAGYFLWPLGLTLMLLAMIDSAAAPRFARLVLAAWAVRIGFVFTAIAVPGLLIAIIKRLIGRARPIVESAGVWTYHPFDLRADYASLPSGHATAAFAAMVAIGSIFPPARPLMWFYALMVIVSRVVVGAHHPSDVVLGAVAGAVGALLVRDWFTARRLGFIVGADGQVRPMPGPRMGRIVKALGRTLRALWESRS